MAQSPNQADYAVYHPICGDDGIYRDYKIKQKEFKSKGGKMRCGCCKTTHVFFKPSAIILHMKSDIHQKNLEELTKNNTNNESVDLLMMPPEPIVVPPSVMMSEDQFHRILQQKDNQIASLKRTVFELTEYIKNL
jgi:hypothetical protein